jgi:hypothetical protein
VLALVLEQVLVLEQQQLEQVMQKFVQHLGNSS